MITRASAAKAIFNIVVTPNPLRVTDEYKLRWHTCARLNRAPWRILGILAVLTDPSAALDFEDELVRADADVVAVGEGDAGPQPPVLHVHAVG
jgi:hypothetical protein